MTKRRALGQHMLVDGQVLDGIIKHADIGSDDIVFEIGTGSGVLTAELCNHAGSVISCEVDKKLFDSARKKLAGCSNLLLVNGDGFKLGHGFNVFVSNLPYSRSRTAVEWLAAKDFGHGVIVVQKEFAEKLLATEGNTYRAVSVLAQHCLDMQRVMHVSRNCFEPRPRVDSVMLKIVKKNSASKDTISVLKLLFSFRGKKLRGALKKLKLNIDAGDARVESLEPEKIMELAKEIARQRSLQTVR